MSGSICGAHRAVLAMVEAMLIVGIAVILSFDFGDSLICADPHEYATLRRYNPDLEEHQETCGMHHHNSANARDGSVLWSHNPSDEDKACILITRPAVLP